MNSPQHNSHYSNYMKDADVAYLRGAYLSLFHVCAITKDAPAPVPIHKLFL